MSTVAIIALASAFVTHATAHTPTASMEPALLTTLALALGDGAIAAADGHAVDAAHAVHSTSGYADVGPLHFVKDRPQSHWVDCACPAHGSKTPSGAARPPVADQWRGPCL